MLALCACALLAPTALSLEFSLWQVLGLAHCPVAFSGQCTDGFCLYSYSTPSAVPQAYSVQGMWASCALSSKCPLLATMAGVILILLIPWVERRSEFCLNASPSFSHALPPMEVHSAPAPLYLTFKYLLIYKS